MRSSPGIRQFPQAHILRLLSYSLAEQTRSFSSTYPSFSCRLTLLFFPMTSLYIHLPIPHIKRQIFHRLSQPKVPHIKHELLINLLAIIGVEIGFDCCNLGWIEVWEFQKSDVMRYWQMTRVGDVALIVNMAED